MALLRATLATYPEAKVVNSGPLWLEVIFTTTFGFKDQVDFVVEGQMGQIAYRSKSLRGTCDFDKNRSRMTDFTQRFAAGARKGLGTAGQADHLGYQISSFKP